ncbi:MAG: DUF1854 domain-containing protein [Verrucomicrobiaceae bacterium]|nr:DUF1854 domain-containing protein [Verrucomicrobiaceae bacterium]
MKLSLTGSNLSLIDAVGVRHDNLRPVRLFPLTEPRHWISLVDEKGHEAACIDDLDALDPEQRAIVEAALARRDFVPVVKRITAIKRATEGHDWHVETDRGPTVFRIETDESIQSLGGTRLVIFDKAGTRYLIPDVAALDHDSRRKLERYF